MTLWSIPRTWSNDEPVGSYLLNRYLRDPLVHLSDGTLPQRAHLYHYQSVVTAGNAITLTAATACFDTYYAYQNASANGDSWTQSFVLLPGSYLLTTTYRKDNTSGILKLALDGVEFAADIDMYNGATINVNNGAHFMWVDTPGRHVLTGTVTGKNGASGGYDIKISGLEIMPNNNLDGDY